MILDGTGLTPAAVEAVARGGERVELADDARERNAAALRALGDVLDGGGRIYGVTTGVGPFRTRDVPPEQRGEQQLRLLRSHASGAGGLLPRERVRATMVVRANQLGAGGAGVSTGLHDALVSALNDDLVPPVHDTGSLGTADLTILAEIALALIDRYDLELGPRDGIGFMSSNAEAIGHASLLAVSARHRLERALRVAALSFLATGADPIVLDERVHAARPHPGQVGVAARMRDLLGPEARVRRGADSPIQDPFPFRAFAQVEGLVADALDALDRVLAVELNAAAENALVDAGEPAVLPNANFHAGALALALDRLRAALAGSASLAASRVTAMLEPDLTGLPAMLASDAGPGSGGMMLEYTAHPAAAEVRVLAAPVTAQTTSVGGGTESHASFAPLAARMSERALDAAGVVTATELVTAVRGLRMRGVEPTGSPAADFYERAAAVLEADMDDRPLGEDLVAARRLLESD